MIILDTNVVSAMMRSSPDVAVAAWFDRQPRRSIWITVITVFEVQAGMALVEPSRRRRALAEAFLRTLGDELEQRVLAFDRESAVAAADLWADRRRRGEPVELRDTQIAGIAIAHHGSIATRNVRHFSDLPVEVVDPWSNPPT